LKLERKKILDHRRGSGIAGVFRSYPLTATAAETNSRRKENMMGTESRPNSDYTRTWSPSGEIEYATLADGTRLRYLRAGSGPALILLHTVRTQLDHFQLVIPKLVHAFTVFAIDMPGMGWSDITPGASYAEPALRRATVEFVKTLDLDDVTLAGESMGATVSLTASTELEDRVRGIVAFTTYDYSKGVSRANRVASFYVGGARLRGGRGRAPPRRQCTRPPSPARAEWGRGHPRPRAKRWSDRLARRSIL
jgi:pimeloyl-ACP methyl ester carboxylesterase